MFMKENIDEKKRIDTRTNTKLILIFQSYSEVNRDEMLRGKRNKKKENVYP